MKRNQNPSNKLLWAFNPFQDSPAHLKNSLVTSRILSGQTGLAVEPVYVVSPSEVNVVLEFSVPAKERYRKVSLDQARKILRSLTADDLSPTILVEKSLSLSASAKVLADYAESRGAEAILVPVRSQKSFREALLGSFAEALLHQAPCPLILVDPRYPVKSAIRCLLFVSDLSTASLETFDRYCAWASLLGAEIALFHSIPPPFSWASFAIDSLLGPDRASKSKYFYMARKQAEQRLKSFAAVVARHRVAFSSAIVVSRNDIAEDAEKEAKKRKAGMLGLAGKSGPWKTRLLGSVSKDLLKGSKLPLWIQHANRSRTR